MSRESELLNANKGLIFRITHLRNVPWILDNGLHCRNSTARDPNFVEIGNQELIAKRKEHAVAFGPGGTLSDYVPFYFTPWSPMLYNIKTGYRGLPQRAMSEIAILVSSVPKLDELGLRYLISDRHAYLQVAQFATDARGLHRIDWPLLQSRDFKRDPEHPEKFDRYQAEGLVHRHVPCGALLGIVCHGEPQKQSLEVELNNRRLKLTLLAQPDMFF